MKNIKQKGQVLVEALVALGTATVIIGAIVILVINALNNSKFATNQNLAAQYAKQGIEIVREMSEIDWVTFNSLSGEENDSWYCLYKDVVSITTDDVSDSDLRSCKWENGIFTRKVRIRQNSSECPGSEVSVIVAWNDSKCTDISNPYCHKVQIDSCFTNLKTIPSV